MSLYVITAIQFSASGEVERVKWAKVDGMANKFDLHRATRKVRPWHLSANVERPV